MPLASTTSPLGPSKLTHTFSPRSGIVAVRMKMPPGLAFSIFPSPVQLPSSKRAQMFVSYRGSFIERRFGRTRGGRRDRCHASAGLLNVDWSLALWPLAALLVVAGVGGLVLPALPGAPLLFAGLFVAAWAEGFSYVGTGTLVLLGVMAALTYAVDFAATALGARRFGASGRAIAGAALGALLGLFFAPIGIFVGPFLGAVLGELSHRRTLPEAGRAGLGATLGLLLGAAAKLALAFSMIGVFCFARLW